MISLIVVTYQSAATIAACLESLLEDDSAEREIIVVDNASTDGTRAIVRRFPDVRLIALPENVGFGAANQAGADASCGGVLVFLNPDTTIENGLLAQVACFFRTHSDVGILGCRILNADGTLQRTGNAFPTFFSLLYEYSAYRRVFPGSRAYRNFVLADWDRRTARVIDAVSGACFAMPRATLEQIGGFDTGFFLYFEEYDLARRVRALGQTVFYNPAMTVKHIGQASTAQLDSSHRQEIYNASCRRYVLKYHGNLQARLLWTLVKLFNFPRQLLQFRKNGKA